MHLADGTLPAGWCIAYGVLAVSGVAISGRSYKKSLQDKPEIKPMVAIMAAATFVMTAIELPIPITGSTSHPAATPLVSLLIGPKLTIIVSTVVLLLQALLLGEGGITTLGANIVTMGILGAFTAFIVYYTMLKLKANIGVAAGLAGFIGDIAVYIGVSLQLSLALGMHDIGKHIMAFLALYMPTQLPIALLEGLFTGGVVLFIYGRRPDLLFTGE